MCAGFRNIALLWSYTLKRGYKYYKYISDVHILNQLNFLNMIPHIWSIQICGITEHNIGQINDICSPKALARAKNYWVKPLAEGMWNFLQACCQFWQVSWTPISSSWLGLEENMNSVHLVFLCTQISTKHILHFSKHFLGNWQQSCVMKCNVDIMPQQK